LCDGSRVRKVCALFVGLAAAALLPARASAHAGGTTPIATSYLAQISSVPSPIEARVIDGDQRLWLRVPPGLTVIVIGLRGEPYLRFSSQGVELNTNSATYFLNRAKPLAVPSGLGSRTAPVWGRLTSAHSVSWHEDRLHTLALAAHPSGSAFLGRWTIPLLVNGGHARIDGTLRQAAVPSLLWFWPVLLVCALVPTLLRLRAARLDEQVAWGLTGLALAASTASRLGQELYARPTISAGQAVLVGVTCLVALGLGALYVRREWRLVAAVAIGVCSLYEGLKLVGTLRHGFVLAVLPAWAERAATIVSLSAGAALVLALAFGGILTRERPALSRAGVRRAAGRAATPPRRA
jgi:hypothetical protein